MVLLIVVKVQSESNVFECELSTFIIDEEEFWSGHADIGANRPQCYLNSLEIREHENVTLKVLDNNGNLNLETILSIHNSKLEKIPEQFLEVLPNLHTFELISSSFKNFDRNYFKNFGILKKLDFIETDIKILEAYTFENLSNLTHLYFHVNPIEEIEENAFVGLENLILLDIDYCHLTHIKENTFRSLKSLERLYLTSSQLKFLDFNLAFNQNLKVIIFMSNEICFIKNKFFHNLGKLENVDLRNNTCVDTEVQNLQRNPTQLQENVKSCFQNFECLLNCDNKLQNDQYSIMRSFYCKISKDNLEMSENFTEILELHSKDLDKSFSKHSRHSFNKLEALEKDDKDLNKTFIEILGKFKEIQQNFINLNKSSENFSRNLLMISENIKALDSNYSDSSSEYQKLIIENLTISKREILHESNGNLNFLFSGILIEFLLLLILFGLVACLIIKPENQVEEYTELTTRI